MSWLSRKTVTVVLLALAGWFGYKGLKIHEQRVSTAAEVSEMESRIADLSRNNQFLASSSAYFGSDAYLERQARLKLNYKLPDEQVAFVYKDTGTKDAAKVANGPDLKNLPNWEKWWYYLTGYRPRN
jgi:cell division protein FtsB